MALLVGFVALTNTVYRLTVCQLALYSVAEI